jgi:NAD-dependent dihydropyrimidine dehydrogenase PreA subunit
MRFLATGSDWWTQASSILPVAVGGAELVRSISETSEQQRGRSSVEDDEDCVGDRPPEDGCPDDKVSEDASGWVRGS